MTQSTGFSALFDKVFVPLGSDAPTSSHFQLIAGTNRDLQTLIQEGRFRDDLLARINLWSYQLPPLTERLEDLEPNVDFELNRWEQQTGHLVSFNKAARAQFLQFAVHPKSTWAGNFRDLNASITRMATLSIGGRINEQTVEDEIMRLSRQWYSPALNPQHNLESLLSKDVMDELDLIERHQLEKVIEICRQSRSMADAGRVLFHRSRLKKKTANDSHRLRQYLSKFGLEFNQLKNSC